LIEATRQLYTDKMKLSHPLLLAAAVWMEKGHACEEIMDGVKKCLGDGQEECEDCLNPGPEFDVGELGTEALKKFIVADYAKCTAVDQPCAPCADLLVELAECEMAKMDMDIPDEPPAQGGLRSGQVRTTDAMADGDDSENQEDWGDILPCKRNRQMCQSCSRDCACVPGRCSWTFVCFDSSDMKGGNGCKCYSDSMCKSGRCSKDFGNFVCADKLEEGESCGENDDCKSNKCQGGIIDGYFGNCGPALADASISSM